MSWLDDYFNSGNDLFVLMTATSVKAPRGPILLKGYREDGQIIGKASPFTPIFFASAELKFHQQGFLPAHYTGTFSSVSMSHGLHQHRVRIDHPSFHSITIGKDPEHGCYVLISPDNILHPTINYPKTDEIDASSVKFLYMLKIFHSARPVDVP